MRTPVEKRFTFGPVTFGVKWGLDCQDRIRFGGGWHDLIVGPADSPERNHYAGGFLKILRVSVSLYVALWGNGQRLSRD